MTFVDLTEGKITIDGVASVRRGVLFHDFVEYDLRSHGGLDIQKIAPKVVTNPYFLHHDQLTRTNYLNLGGGGSYTINDSIDVYGAISNTVSGRNTHAVRYGITFGMSYGFQGFRPPDSGNRVSNSRDSKAVCLCAVKEGSN